MSLDGYVVFEFGGFTRRSKKTVIKGWPVRGHIFEANPNAVEYGEQGVPSGLTVSKR